MIKGRENFRKKKAGFGCGENFAKGVPINPVGRGRGDKSEGRITGCRTIFLCTGDQHYVPYTLLLIS